MILKFLNPTSPAYDNFGPMGDLLLLELISNCFKYSPVCLIYKRVLEEAIKGAEKSGVSGSPKRLFFIYPYVVVPVDISDPFELCKKCLAEAMASIMVGEVRLFVLHRLPYSYSSS
jgi:hypothetical protein